MNPQIEQRGNLGVRLLVVLGVFLLFILFSAYFFYSIQPSDLNGHPGAGVLGTEKSAKFKIEKGEGMRDIAAHLSDGGLIRSVTAFKIYSLISGNAQKFQPGIYDLSSSMSVPKIISELVSGGKNEIQVTIPEGSTVKDAEEILKTAGALSENESFSRISVSKFQEEFPFLEGKTSFEGFLFPDTYRIPLGADAEKTMRVFLSTFELKAWPLLKEEKNWYERLILASYLEREVSDFNDRQLVAGILLKRLKIKMPLQVDSTLAYPKCDEKYRGCKTIQTARSDILISSPYNTYQNLGWTPTPISNPGQSAIKAAVTPKENSYLFYLSAKSGETMFSRTLDEHNQKRAKYL